MPSSKPSPKPVRKREPKPIAKPAAKIAGKIAGKPAAKAAAKTVGKTADKSVAKPVGKTAGKPAAQPVGKITAKPAGKTASKRAAKPALPAAPAAPAVPAVLSTEDVLQRLVALAREKRAEDVVALDVRSLTDYMDYLVIATGRSPRQNRAIADGVMRGLRGLKVRPLVRPGPEDGAWICLDFVDIVFHVLDGATRTHYDLELLWGDALAVELPEPEAPPQA